MKINTIYLAVETLIKISEDNNLISNRKNKYGGFGLPNQRRLRTEPIGISVGEAAELLGVSKPKVYELLKRDDFPACKLGGRVVISYDGLRDWMLNEVNYKKRAQTNII